MPDVVAFADIGGENTLLMTTVPGTNLARLAKRLPATSVVAMLAASGRRTPPRRSRRVRPERA